VNDSTVATIAARQRAPMAVVLFDGVCNLCNGAVRFLIARDRHERLRFAALQSETGRVLLSKYRFPSDYARSLVLVADDRVYVESGAALRIASYLEWPWPLLRLGWLVPRIVRDAMYRFVANHRYAWFGRSAACMIPTENIRRRFLADPQ